MSEKASSRSISLVPIAGPAIDPVILHPNRRTLLGRSPNCDICLADTSISRQHCAVSGQDGQWWVIDLGSRHGTLLNGVRLDAHEPAPTGYGYLLRIGSFMFRMGPDGIAGRILATTVDTVASNTIVEAVHGREFDSIAYQRLSVMA